MSLGSLLQRFYAPLSILFCVIYLVDVIWTYQRFFPVVVHLSSSSWGLILLTNGAFSCYIQVVHLCSCLFFGSISSLERQHVREQFMFHAIETLFGITYFRDTTTWGLIVTLLLTTTLKMAHVLASLRQEALERAGVSQPSLAAVGPVRQPPRTPNPPPTRGFAGPENTSNRRPHPTPPNVGTPAPAVVSGGTRSSGPCAEENSEAGSSSGNSQSPPTPPLVPNNRPINFPPPRPKRLGMLLPVVTVLFVLLLIDTIGVFLVTNYLLLHGMTVYVLVLSDFALMFIRAAVSNARVFLHEWSLWQGGEEEFELGNHLRQILEVWHTSISCVIYVGFFSAITIASHFPLHRSRELLLHMRDAVLTARQYIRYRRLAVHIDHWYADATEEQMQREVRCAICFDDLSGVAHTATNRAGDATQPPTTRRRAKRLLCGHIYHRSCLLRWVEKDSTCPYCLAQLESPQQAPRARGPRHAPRERPPAAPPQQRPDQTHPPRTAQHGDTGHSPPPDAPNEALQQEVQNAYRRYRIYHALRQGANKTIPDTADARQRNLTGNRIEEEKVAAASPSHSLTVNLERFSGEGGGAELTGVEAQGELDLSEVDAHRVFARRVSVAQKELEQSLCDIAARRRANTSRFTT